MLTGTEPEQALLQKVGARTIAWQMVALREGI
jgi:hypothetical protein